MIFYFYILMKSTGNSVLGVINFEWCLRPCSCLMENYYPARLKPEFSTRQKLQLWRIMKPWRSNSCFVSDDIQLHEQWRILIVDGMAIVNQLNKNIKKGYYCNLIRKLFSCYGIIICHIGSGEMINYDFMVALLKKFYNRFEFN